MILIIIVLPLYPVPSRQIPDRSGGIKVTNEDEYSRQKYNGRFINSNHDIEPYPPDWMRNYLAGRGANSFIIFRDIKKGDDPPARKTSSFSAGGS